MSKWTPPSQSPLVGPRVLAALHAEQQPREPHRADRPPLHRDRPEPGRQHEVGGVDRLDPGVEGVDQLAIEVGRERLAAVLNWGKKKSAQVGLVQALPVLDSRQPAEMAAVAAGRRFRERLQRRRVRVAEVAVLYPRRRFAPLRPLRRSVDEQHGRQPGVHGFAHALVDVAPVVVGVRRVFRLPAGRLLGRRDRVPVQRQADHLRPARPGLAEDIGLVFADAGDPGDEGSRLGRRRLWPEPAQTAGEHGRGQPASDGESSYRSCPCCFGHPLSGVRLRGAYAAVGERRPRTRSTTARISSGSRQPELARGRGAGRLADHLAEAGGAAAFGAWAPSAGCRSGV